MGTFLNRIQLLVIYFFVSFFLPPGQASRPLLLHALLLLQGTPPPAGPWCRRKRPIAQHSHIPPARCPLGSRYGKLRIRMELLGRHPCLRQNARVLRATRSAVKYVTPHTKIRAFRSVFTHQKIRRKYGENTYLGMPLRRPRRMATVFPSCHAERSETGGGGRRTRSCVCLRTRSASRAQATTAVPITGAHVEVQRWRS